MQVFRLKPAVPLLTPISLNGLDLLFGVHYHDNVRFFEAGLDIARLQSSLQQALDTFPVLAGRLVLSDGKGFSIEPGAELILAVDESSGSLPAFGANVFPLETEGLMLHVIARGKLSR